MKRILSVLLILTILSGCASTAPPTRKPSPDWQYDLTRDGVFRTDRNTGDTVQLNSSDYPTGIIITEDWVYYRDENRHLYRMDNGNTKELLVGEESWPLYLNGDILYYLSISGLNRMNVDGSEKEHVFDCDYTGIEMTDTYVFYTLETPESEKLNNEPGSDDIPWYMGELHRVGLDGKGDVVVAELVTGFSIYEDLLYYADGSDNAFYSLDPETLAKNKIENITMVDDMCLGDGYLFFTTAWDRCFYKLSLQDGTLTWLAGGWPRCSGILDGYVYFDTYTGEEPGLYRVKTDGTEPELIELLIPGLSSN